LAAKIITVLVVEIVQVALLIPIALLLDWRADDTRWLLALGAVGLGTAAFGGLGLFIAGRLRAEINLAAQNGLYIALLLLGGMVIPFENLPGPMESVAKYLPSGALADVLRDALIGSGAATQPSTSWIVLAAWAVAMPLVAAATFRWE
jgi:ABC-2 type transport system permease protein